MEGLRLGAPLAQTGRVMGMRNPQGPPIDPPGSLMSIYVALAACLLVLARSPAILATAFSSRSCWFLSGRIQHCSAGGNIDGCDFTVLFLIVHIRALFFKDFIEHACRGKYLVHF